MEQKEVEGDCVLEEGNIFSKVMGEKLTMKLSEWWYEFGIYY